jgi:3-phosphoshikimate 1-carboxyvinyltransferase
LECDRSHSRVTEGSLSGSAYDSIEPLSSRSSATFEPRIPGSKSYTNRALVLAAQRSGATRIERALHSQDTDGLARCLDSYRGLAVEATEDGFFVERTSASLGAPAEPLHLGAAGTPARLLLCFAAGAVGHSTITGGARLCERPMQHLLSALDGIGIAHVCLGAPGCLPVRVSGGRVRTHHWEVDGSVSSQFVTGLLLFAAQQDRRVRVRVLGHLVSKPYVETTVHMLRELGIAVSHDGLREFEVEPGEIRPDIIVIEPDASAMSYFLAAAALTRTRVRIAGIGASSAQGDVGLARALAEMGCRVELGADFIELEGKELCGIEIDMERMPDVVLTLAVVAARARGETVISNISNLRVKECDRIHAAATELCRLGVDVEQGPDFLRIRGGADGPLRPARVTTYDDHRVAMSFGLLKLVAPGIEIDDPACTAKSFPGFWQELARFQRHHLGSS